MPTTHETLRAALVASRRDRSLIEMAAQPVPASFLDGLAIQADIAKTLDRKSVV